MRMAHANRMPCDFQPQIIVVMFNPIGLLWRCYRTGNK